MKKTKFTLAVLLLVASLSSFAQDWEGKTYHYWSIYPGYVVTKSGDTLKGFIEHQDRNGNQNKCIFFSDLNNKKSKVVYKPEDITEYHVGDKTYRSITYSGGLLDKIYKFNLLIKDGAIAQYRFYTFEQSGPVTVRGNNETEYQFDQRNAKEESVFCKKGMKPVSNTSLILGFKKKMAELLSDYPELAKKVENKEDGYKLLQVYKIIDEYNNYMLNKK
jgi:hypothetical protein